MGCTEPFEQIPRTHFSSNPNSIGQKTKNGPKILLTCPQIYAAYNVSALRKRCNYTLSSRLSLDDCAAQNASLHAVKDELKELFQDLDKVT